MNEGMVKVHVEDTYSTNACPSGCQAEGSCRC